MRLKPQKVYWSKELLDYFIGTDQGFGKLNDRSEIWCWLRDNSHEFKFNHSICRITDRPHSGFSPMNEVVDDFFNQALEEFGTYDYEFQESRPCGGWKYLDIIVC